MPRRGWRDSSARRAVDVDGSPGSVASCPPWPGVGSWPASTGIGVPAARLRRPIQFLFSGRSGTVSGSMAGRAGARAAGAARRCRQRI